MAPGISHSSPTLADDDFAAVLAQLKTGQLAAGETARRFERAFAQAVGADADATLAVGSGTEALRLALKLLGVGAGDRVVLPTYTCRAVHDAVVAAGARPVVCDVGEDYALAARGPAAAAIVVHPFGRPVPLAPLRALGCPIVEDCAHAILPASEADVSVYSFSATKVLATGEGGAVVARTPARGELGAYVPLSDLAASLGLSQLARLPEFQRRRRELAAIYDAALGQSTGDHAPFRWVTRVDADFARLKAAMAERGIAIRRPVDPLVHHELGLDSTEFPVAQRLYESTISLPLYPSLADADARRVAAELIDALERCGAGV